MLVKEKKYHTHKPSVDLEVIIDETLGKSKTPAVFQDKVNKMNLMLDKFGLPKEITY